jgi:hypothetical protein
MKKTNRFTPSSWSTALLLAALGGLGGCISAMDTIVGAAASANATPISMGVTTTQFRGQSCESLAQQLEMFRKSQAGESNDLMRKSWGWNAEAVQTVQNDQGCTPAGAAAGRTTPKDMKMYFYCHVSEDIDRVNTRGIVKSMTTVYTGIFERTVSLTDPMHRFNLVNAFTDEFKLKVMPSYDLGKNTHPSCVYEDSLATATAMRQHLRHVNGVGVSTTNIDVNWQPTVTVQAAAPAKPVAAKNGAKPIAAIDVSALGARFEPVSDKAAKAAGLARTEGAALVSVTAGGPAARAGLKPKDIVTTISGQAIAKPEDIEAVMSTLGGGVKAPVQLRRGGKKMELSVQLAGPAAAKASVATPAASPAAPATPVAVAAAPVVAPKASGPKSCAAWLLLGNERPPKDGVVARFEMANADDAGMRSAFGGFVTHMNRTEGKWNADFSKNLNCNPLICISFTAGMFKTPQQAAVTCQDTSDLLEQRFPHVKAGEPGLRKVEWLPT